MEIAVIFYRLNCYHYQLILCPYNVANIHTCTICILEKPDATERLDPETMTDTLSKYTHQKEGRDQGILYTRVEVQWPLDWLKVKIADF